MGTAPLWMRQSGAWLRAKITHVPLIGPLARCTLAHHQSAIKEFFAATLFGTATFWLTAGLLMGFTVHAKASYDDLLYLTVSSGQLFIFSVGLLGPIMLAAADDPEKNDKFPGRFWHVTTLLVLCIAASSFYALELASREPEAAALFNKGFLFNASLTIAAIVVVMRYLTIVYRKSTQQPDVPQQMQARHEIFLDAFKHRHDGGES